MRGEDSQVCCEQKGKAPMSEKHVVTLNSEELEDIEKLLRKGQTAARKLKRANILRLADAT
jgi:hypothetical protein